MAQQQTGSRSGPVDRLKSEARGLVGALGNRALSSVRDRIEGTSGRLNDYVEGGGGPGVIAAFTGARNLAEGKSPGRSMLGAGMANVREKVAGMFGRRGKGGGGKKLKVTNIVESIDVGVPVKVAYNQWTQYSDLPKFMKKLENVDQPEDGKSTWKAQVFWSHRTWEATIVDQVPEDRIIWRSKGQKGQVDGALTFHELAPNLTRMLLILEYHPQGMFERTGNLWRAQGRRARLEFKHFQRHMMSEGVLHADEVEGWRGTIHDSEVVESHEDAMAREERENSGQDAGPQDAERNGDQETGGEDSGARSRQRSEGQRSEGRPSEGQRSGGRQSEGRRSEGQRSGGRQSEGRRSEGQRSGGRHSEGRAAEGGTEDEPAGEGGNGRAATAGRTRRSPVSRASGSGGGNGRRQQANAGTR